MSYNLVYIAFLAIVDICAEKSVYLFLNIRNKIQIIISTLRRKGI